MIFVKYTGWVLRNRKKNLYFSKEGDFLCHKIAKNLEKCRKKEKV